MTAICFTAIPRRPKNERILLMQEIEPGAPLWCMHHLVSQEGWQTFCNQRTEETCVGCGRPICPQHWSTRTLTVADREGSGAFWLCRACATLSREDLESLRQVRLSLNR